MAAYLACDRSLAKAADLLHVARNTVAYRVKKVESLIGRDLRERKLAQNACASPNGWAAAFSRADA